MLTISFPAPLETVNGLVVVVGRIVTLKFVGFPLASVKPDNSFPATDLVSAVVNSDHTCNQSEY